MARRLLRCSVLSVLLLTPHAEPHIPAQRPVDGGDGTSAPATHLMPAIRTGGPASQPWKGKQVQGWGVPFSAPAGDIAVESNGVVWFCQPTLVSLTRFDPKTEAFTLHNPGFIGPQGVTLDSAGVLWAALSTGGKLDELDPATGTDVHHALPYPGAHPSKMMRSSTGTIWTVDPPMGVLSELDPDSGTWLQSLVVPTPGGFPTSIAEDPATGTIFATCTQIDRIAIFPPGQPPFEIATPPFHPTSCVWSQGLLYYVLASQPKLLTFDPATGQQKSHTYGPASDPASVAVALPDGRIVVGTQNGFGNLHVFDPTTTSFTKHELPTALDGSIRSMTLGASGELWLTLGGATTPAFLVRVFLP